jgi:type IV pilus assembly protein PilQ
MKNGFFILALFLSLNSTRVSGQSIRSVDFIQEGEVSKLIIDVDKPIVADSFHVKDDKQIILDLKGVKADKKTLRGIDTSEFDGATVFISGYAKPGAPNDVRFAVQLRDNVRSILETQGSKIVLNIENRFGVFSKAKVQNAENGPVKSSAGSSAATTSVAQDEVRINVPRSTDIEDILTNLTLSGPKKYVGKKISINVKEIPLPDLLRMIADTSGFNIIIDSDVAKTQPLTLALTNIPWDQALDTILSLSRLIATKNSNILSIKTIEKATAEREAEAKAEQLKLGLEPLVTKVFPISYAKIDELKTILADYITEKRGKLSQDNRTNSLIVRDTVDAIERIKKILELLDTQTPQILIESKFVEVAEQHSKSIGLTNGLSFGYDPVGAVSASSGPGLSFSSAGGGTETNPFAIGLQIARSRRLVNLDLSLQMLESESKARIVTSPKVITQNKTAANISSTETFNFPQVVPGVNGASTVQLIPITAPLSLLVTPQVTNEGSIDLTISLNKSSLVRSAGNVAPGQISNTISTKALVDNGSTIVVGGIYSSNKSENHSGMPFLKDLPLIGWLFRTPYNPAETRSELLVFITPRIINQEEAGLVDRQNASSL